MVTVRMIFSSAFCFLLTTSITNADKEKLMKEISTVVAHDMVKVSRADEGSVDLNTRLLDTVRRDLRRMEPQVQALVAESGSVPGLARELATKIYRNKDLMEAQRAPDGRRHVVQPRFFGALAVGITQIVSDVINMSLRRY